MLEHARAADESGLMRSRLTSVWRSRNPVQLPSGQPSQEDLRVQIDFRGAMELWVEGAVDLEGLETQLLYGMTLCLLAVAIQKGRPRLLRHLRDLEQQLDRQIHE